MRFFISSFTGFSLAIPMEYVSSIFLSKDISAKEKVEHDEENRSTHISLPLLFNCPQEEVYHGVILRNKKYNANDSIGTSEENQIILLNTKIESEVTIEKEDCFSIPKALSSSKISQFFNGMIFISDKLVLLLDPKQLVENT